MDKLYKKHFLSQLKARMPIDRVDFQPHKLPPIGHPLRARFVGSLLYLKELPTGRCVWLEGFSGEGMERKFFAELGWSFSSQVLPTHRPGDMRLYSIKEPSPGFNGGALNVQAVEGRQAIAGFNIPTPWDQLYALGPRVSEDERNRVMKKAHAEYLAGSEAERISAVRSALDEAFGCIAKVLNRFTALALLNDCRLRPKSHYMGFPTFSTQNAFVLNRAAIQHEPSLPSRVR